MIFAGDENFGNPCWYAGGIYAQRRVSAHGITPSENRFLKFTPLFFLASDLFPAMYMRQRKGMAKLPLETISRSRKLAFTGEQFDQADLDVLLACFGEAIESGGLASNGIRLGFKEIVQNLKFRPGKAGREKVLTSLHRLEQARLEVYNTRYRLSLQPVNKLLLDAKKETCLLELHPIVRDTFKNIPGLRVFLQERASLGRNGLAKWLHAVSWANGGRFYMNINRMRSLAGLQTQPRKKTIEHLRQAVQLLDDNHLLRHMEVRGEQGIIMAGTRKDQQHDKCMMFQ